MKLVKIEKGDLSEINKMLVPILIEQAFLASIGLLISYFLKQTGTQAVASVGLMNNFNMLMNNVFQSFGVGVAVVVAQYCGKGDSRATGKVAMQGLIISIGAALLVSCGCFIFREGLLRFLLADSEEQVYVFSRIYLKYYLVAIPFIATYTVTASAIRGSGHPKNSLITIVLFNGLYALFSGVATLVLKQGFESVCISQCASAIIAAIVGVILLKKGNENMVLGRFTLKMDSEIIKPMVKVGIPVLIENTLFALGRLITQTFAIPYGTNYTAANGIVNNINNIMSVPVVAAINTAPPLIGRYCGMGDKEKAMQRGRQLTTLIVYMQCVISIIAVLIINPLTNAMTDSEEVRELIKQVIYLKAIVQPVGYTLAFVWPAVMRSAGDAKYVMIVNTLTMFIARLGIAYTLTKYCNLGILGIWIGQYTDWYIRIIFFWKRFRSGKWLEFSLFEDEEGDLKVRQ